MGTTLPKDVTIAGVSMTTIKRALRGYITADDVISLMARKTIFGSRMEGAVVYEEMLERGLINPDAEARDDHLTEAGMALATGKARRASIEKADEVLDAYLDHVAKHNADPNALDYVDQVWLYGSAMRREETVGDIDLAFTKVRNPAYEDDAALRARLRELMNMAPAHMSYLDASSWAWGHGIEPGRRHPLLSGLREGVHELVEMGVPCKLVFDRASGGKVDRDIQPRHPESKGRSNQMPAPRVLPDLAPPDTAPRPMDARWMSAYRYDSGNVLPRTIFEERLDETLPGVGLFALSNKTTWQPQSGWQPKALRADDIDGSHKVVLVFDNDYADPEGKHSTAVTVVRTVEQSDTGPILRVKLEDLERRRGVATKPDLGDLQVTLILGLLVATDCWRQVTRLMDRGDVGKQVEIHFDFSNLPEVLRKPYAELVMLRFHEQTFPLGPDLPEGVAPPAEFVLNGFDDYLGFDSLDDQSETPAP